MKQSTKRFFSLIAAFVLVTAAFLIYFNLAEPVYQEAQERKAQAMSRESFVQNQRASILQVKNSIASYKGEGQFQDVVSLALPLNPDLAGAFAQITSLVQNNRLALQGVTVNVPVMQTASVKSKALSGKTVGASATAILKPFGVITFQIRLIGSYEDFKAFLKNLESNIRIFDIQKISFQPAAKPDQNLYMYDLTVSTYYQGQ
ncbi:MAG: hypothetical protein HY433_00170 [Candidatus Liptonbacteria bacterium]|nr:hypothetical protein [Candidatus Liptonbacteria bacterium]